MAGMGPPRKHTSVRARTNKASTRATLVENEEGETVEIPGLPEMKAANGMPEEWHPLTVAWWHDIWPSPMASEWHSSDITGLYALAMLYDSFFKSPSEKKHAELRNARTPYGLTPLDRRRLEWSIETTKKAQSDAQRRTQPQQSASTPEPGEDPRLYVV